MNDMPNWWYIPNSPIILPFKNFWFVVTLISVEQDFLTAALFQNQHMIQIKKDNVRIPEKYIIKLWTSLLNYYSKSELRSRFWKSVLTSEPLYYVGTINVDAEIIYPTQEEKEFYNNQTHSLRMFSMPQEIKELSHSQG